MLCILQIVTLSINGNETFPFESIASDVELKNQAIPRHKAGGRGRNLMLYFMVTYIEEHR